MIAPVAPVPGGSCGGSSGLGGQDRPRRSPSFPTRGLRQVAEYLVATRRLPDRDDATTPGQLSDAGEGVTTP